MTTPLYDRLDQLIGLPPISTSPFFPVVNGRTYPEGVWLDADYASIERSILARDGVEVHTLESLYAVVDEGLPEDVGLIVLDSVQGPAE